MTDVTLWINGLRRPGLLMNAARHGLNEYNREQVLKRVMPSAVKRSPERALEALIPVEETLESARRAGDASYTPSRHVEVMIALMAELRSVLAGPRLV